MGNKKAKKGNVFVCMACGKRSEDEYGDNALDRGWDVSCMMNCQEFPISKLEMKDGRVVKIKE
ncbi:hypothetical protein N9948_01675 [bacterium]|nr:hypothetical protein [bacterium]